MSDDSLKKIDRNDVIGKKQVTLSRTRLLFDRFLRRFLKKAKPASNDKFKNQWSDPPAWF